MSGGCENTLETPELWSRGKAVLLPPCSLFWSNLGSRTTEMAWGLGLQRVTWSLRASVFLVYKVGVITLSVSLGSSASISDNIRSLWLRSTL